jgi:hypothetical protein
MEVGAVAWAPIRSIRAFSDAFGPAPSSRDTSNDHEFTTTIVRDQHPDDYRAAEHAAVEVDARAAADALRSSLTTSKPPTSRAAGHADTLDFNTSARADPFFVDASGFQARPPDPAIAARQRAATALAAALAAVAALVLILLGVGAYSLANDPSINRPAASPDSSSRTAADSSSSSPDIDPAPPRAQPGGPHDTPQDARRHPLWMPCLNTTLLAAIERSRSTGSSSRPCGKVTLALTGSGAALSDLPPMELARHVRDAMEAFFPNLGRPTVHRSQSCEEWYEPKAATCASRLQSSGSMSDVEYAKGCFRALRSTMQGCALVGDMRVTQWHLADGSWLEAIPMGGDNGGFIALSITSEAPVLPSPSHDGGCPAEC